MDNLYAKKDNTKIYDLTPFNVNIDELRLFVENKSMSAWLPYGFKINLYSPDNKLLYSHFINWPSEKVVRWNVVRKYNTPKYELSLGI